jgi:hypothetical protein
VSEARRNGGTVRPGPVMDGGDGLEAYLPMEADPTGRGQHEPGAKLDSGKVRAGLVMGGFARALVEVAKVGTFGAAKYTDNGWRSVPNGQQRYTDALYRHLLEEAQGLECDAGSNLLHAAHTAWNALARLELILLDMERRQ